jgi:hypothetical protein
MGQPANPIRPPERSGDMSARQRAMMQAEQGDHALRVERQGDRLGALRDLEPAEQAQRDRRLAPLLRRN